MRTLQPIAPQRGFNNIKNIMTEQSCIITGRQKAVGYVWYESCKWLCVSTNQYV